MERKFLAADVERIDHEVASTAWEETRRCRRCGVRGVFFLRRLRKRQADEMPYGGDRGSVHESAAAVPQLHKKTSTIIAEVSV